MEKILFGAGATGLFVVRDMITIGTVPLAFADNDPNKQGTRMKGVPILSPEDCAKAYPDAEWICTIMDPKPMDEVLAQIASMGVKTSSFWGFIPNRNSDIPDAAFTTITTLAGDTETINELIDQQRFRKHQNHKMQRPVTPLEDLYFPEFFTRLDDEVLCDFGSADGDTIDEFLKRWDSFGWIYGFEPDSSNFNKLFSKYLNQPKNMTLRMAAVGDHEGEESFTSTGDYSAHLDPNGETEISITTIDNALRHTKPTYMKFDIEGSEPEALWGAKSTIRKHNPVLAVCSYHTADHIWQLPLLIHALNPRYKLYLRRYRPGTWETVWYAVPLERIAK